MSELSGRELDRAIAEALGYIYLDPPEPFESEVLTGDDCFHRFIRPDGQRCIDIPWFHKSLDAIKRVEDLTDIDEFHVDWVNRGYWLVRYSPKEEADGYVAGQAKTEPEARARALLAWLERDA